ncbi:MAG: hypothetical protein HY007_02180 [Candidatus Sungbacteria bacterium]|nr:hypothetical protein [Candidatus Sungbacteria bacterium]
MIPTFAEERKKSYAQTIMFRHRKKLNIIWIGISVVAGLAMIASLFLPLFLSR